MQVLIATRAPQRFESWIAALEEAGFEVRTAPPDYDALSPVRLPRPDVALLDLAECASPASFRSLLGKTSRGAATALICVAPDERLAELRHEPIDDFLPALASTEEVLYRVCSAAERSGGESRAVVAGELIVGPHEGQVLLHNHRVSLRGQEYALLRFLAANPDRVFRREVLAREVWGNRLDGSLRTVDTHIHRLRSRLGAFGRERIQTVRGVGYRLASAASRR